ncbi:MAG: tryptophan synthase subunit alpha [Chlamydiota bacterium]
MIAHAFQKGPAFIGYLTLGDGGLDYSYEAALALIEGGVDLLEIGIPFSDPVADGPVIAQAMQRSLKLGTVASDVIPFLRRLREKTEIPLVLFSYCNPILTSPGLLDRAKEAGANGILLVDLPFEESVEGPLDPIYVISPTTPGIRVQQIAERGKGFLYYVCQKGTTGMRATIPKETAQDIARVKKLTSLPVVCGFGISNREMAGQVSQHADGFVVGSYFVNAMAQKMSPEQLTHMAQAIDPRRIP